MLPRLSTNLIADGRHEDAHDGPEHRPQRGLEHHPDGFGDLAPARKIEEATSHWEHSGFRKVHFLYFGHEARAKPLNGRVLHNHNVLRELEQLVEPLMERLISPRTGSAFSTYSWSAIAWR